MQFLSEEEMSKALEGQFWVYDRKKGVFKNALARTAGVKPAAPAKSEIEAKWFSDMNDTGLPMADEVVALTERVCDLDQGGLRSYDRCGRVAKARHAAVRLIYAISGRSPNWVGRQVSRNQSTARHSLSDKQDTAEVGAIEAKVLAVLRTKYPAVDARIAETKSKSFQRVI